MVGASTRKIINVYSSFFRRSGPQDRPGEGIGLAHVRALVRRLGGTMGLTSELGRGSVFTVTLPRRWVGENNRSVA